jgi:hypothetical protein
MYYVRINGLIVGTVVAANDADAWQLSYEKFPAEWGERREVTTRQF